MTHPLNMTYEELEESAIEQQRLIRFLEKKGARRTAAQNQQLKNTRATRREIMRELARRSTQLRLPGFNPLSSENHYKKG